MEERFDKHQLAGLDARERGFSRPVVFVQVGEGYRAILRYETTLRETGLHTSQDDALHRLIHILHSDGYRQLRTQMSFRNGVYLGSQEFWVEYPDPVSEPKREGLLARIIGWFRPHPAHE